MITIKNYDSRLALSNYQIGDLYTFYIHNSNLKNLSKVKDSEFETHVKSLTDTIEMNKSVITNNDQYLNFTRSIGIIVDTHESTHLNDIDSITVLFKTPSSDFVINKYVVNSTQTFIWKSCLYFYRQWFLYCWR